MRINVLQRWWPRVDEQNGDAGVSNARPQAVDLSAVVLKYSPRPASEDCVQNCVRENRQTPARAPAKSKRHRRHKKHDTASLWTDHDVPTIAEIQAAAVLHEIAAQRPHKVGKWVTRKELEDWYRKLAVQEGWEKQGWIPIAVALREWTSAKRIERSDGKLTRYQIIPITPALRRRALMARPW